MWKLYLVMYLYSNGAQPAPTEPVLVGTFASEDYCKTAAAASAKLPVTGTASGVSSGVSLVCVGGRWMK
ncbi:MAG: hypothetical protein U1E56_06560 [Bauldia sp.]